METEILQPCFWARNDAKPTQTVLSSSFCLHLLPACSARGYQAVALCSVFACSERQEREPFPRSRDQKDLDFVPVVLLGMTKKPAAVLTQYSVQLLLPCLCCCRSQAVTDRARRHCLQRRKLLSCP